MHSNSHYLGVFIFKEGVKLFYNALKEFKKVKTLTSGALLTALYTLSATFLHFYPSESIKISVSFIFIAVAAYLYGPVMAMVVGAMGDFLAWVVHPHGALLIGITLAYGLSGVVFGLFYYKEKFSLPRCILACAVETLLIEMLLKTLVLSHAYGTPFGAQFVMRLPAVCIMLVVMIVLSFVFFKFLKPVLARIKK